MLPSPIHITSYLNTINIRQKTTDSSNLNLNASIRVQPGNEHEYRNVSNTMDYVTFVHLPCAFFVVVFADFNYKYKLATGNDEVESCHPSPCKNDGKCITNGNINRCQCFGHFTGR